MKKILIILVSLLVWSLGVAGQTAAKESSLTYKFYDQETGAVNRQSYINVKDLPTKEKAFHRKVEGKNYVINDEFVVGPDGMTQTFKRDRTDEDTSYVGEKKGNTVHIKGKLKGEDIDKTINLKNKPFYDIPKFNLTRFVLSDVQKIKFYMLRKDKLKTILMQAKKKGVETIEVNGKPVEAVRVYYAATGVREKYYRRDYYFRKSDGVFVKKVEPDGSIGELIDEE